MAETNGTILEQFVLIGFSGNTMIQVTIFVALLMAYIITMAGNVLIIVIICMDCRLHSPMYLFLVCLSFTDLLMVSFVIPKLLGVLVAENTISKSGCFIQSYLYYFIITADFLIFTAMSIDRYVAICYPFRYSFIMRKSICITLVASCFLTPFLCLLYPTVAITHLPFCGHVVDHFSCETAAMLKLVCADISLIKLNTIIASILILIGCLTVTAISYCFIVFMVLRMPFDTRRQKTFSTCLSHLTVLSIFFGGAIFIGIRPPKEYSMETDKIVNLVSTIISPLINPFIYTLRNQNVKDCIQDAMKCTKLLN